MKTEERIGYDAEQYADSKAIRGSSFHQGARKGYIHAATSERNKTIDEAIDIVTDYQDYNPLIIERLKAMKV